MKGLHRVDLYLALILPSAFSPGVAKAVSLEEKKFADLPESVFNSKALWTTNLALYTDKQCLHFPRNN